MVAPLGEGATPRENCLFGELSGSSCTKTSPTGGRDRGGSKQAAGRPSRPVSPGIHGQPVPSPTREGPTPEVARDQMSPPNPHPQRGWAQTERRRRRCQGRREGECRSPQRTRAEPAARRHAAERGAAGPPRPGPLSSRPVPPGAPGPPARPPGGRRGACRVPPPQCPPPSPSARGGAAGRRRFRGRAPLPPLSLRRRRRHLPWPRPRRRERGTEGGRGGGAPCAILPRRREEGHPWEGRPGQDEGGGLTGGPARPPTPSVVEKRSL